MNALFVSVIKKKKILVANEGRLLKKCILGFLILSLAFQTNDFAAVVRTSLIDAYLNVSVFVAFTLFIFLGLDSLTNFEIKNFLKKSKKFHVLFSSFLGSLPGCGGAIIVVTQFIQGRLSFGSLVAVLTSTMGDAAFLLLAKQPMQGMIIFIIAFSTGLVTGYLVDIFHKRDYLLDKKKLNVEFESIKKTFVSKFNILWIIVFFPGLLIGILNLIQVNVDDYFFLYNDFSVVNTIGSFGAVVSIFMWTLNPLSDFQCSTEKSRSYLSRTIDTTNFVTTWVVCGFLFYESFIFFSNFDIKIIFDIWKPVVPLIAIFMGFVPGCGPQILVTTFYLNGIIPFSAEIGNAISNDGDALFPAIAILPKAAIIATLYSAIPAVLVSYTYFFVFENNF